MMKRTKLSIYVVLFAVCGLFATEAKAFLIPLPMIPCMPTLDPMKDAVHTLQQSQVISLINGLKEAKNTINGITDIKGLGVSYNKGTCFLNCANTGDSNKRPVKAAKEIQNTNVADIYDPASVKKAFYKLFLVMPSDELYNETCYKSQGRKFFKDTAVEIYSSASALEKEIANIEQRIADLSKALEEGSSAVASSSASGSSESAGLEADTDEANNSNTAWENAYQSYDVLDQLLRMTQELKAMRMQYEASLAIMNKAAPIRNYEAEEIKNDKTSFIINESKKYAGASSLSFAQASVSNKAEEEDYNFLGMVDAPKPDAKSPFAGNEENLQAIADISAVGQEVYGALNLHTLIAALPAYKDIFVSYDRVDRAHQHALNMLKVSDQCTINYLGKYYKNPEQVWSGGNMGSLVNQHEMRKGVSKWLIDAFDTAKAQMISPLNPEELNTPIMDASVDNKNLVSSDTLKSSKGEGGDIVNPVKERKGENIGRTNYLLPWNLAADLSRDLAKDQQEGHKWGAVKQTFPLWHDQKNYYREYIDEKYDNIIDYLEKIDLRLGEIDIARELNKKAKDVVVKNSEAAAKNKWLPDLNDFASASPLEAIGIPESEWIAPIKQKMTGIASNHVKLNERETALKKRKTQLLAQIQTPITIAEIAKIDAELDDIAKDRSWLNSYNEGLKGIVKTEEWTVATKNNLINTQEEEARDLAVIVGGFTDAINSYRQEIANTIKSRNNELEAYEKRLEILSVQIDEAEAKMNLYNKNINKYEEGNLEVRENFVSENSSPINKADMKKKSEEQKALAIRLGKEAKTLIEKIDERYKYYDSKIANAERTYAKKIKELYEEKDEFYNPASLSAIYNGKTIKGIASGDFKYTAALNSYFGTAFAITEEFRAYGVLQAERAKEDILNLKENLYYQTSNGTVNSRHKKLIDELKGISYDDLFKVSSMLRSSYGDATVILDAVKALYTKYVVEQLCPGEACYARDSQYFIGFTSKARDFQAPKEPIDEYVPPLREVFYFDEINYAKIFSKSNTIKITELAPGSNIPFLVETRYYVSRYSLLEYGGRIPEVWKLVLSNQGFVEKDIDMEKFFSSDADKEILSVTNFLRGGRYPCIINNLKVDIDKGERYIIGTSTETNLPTCREIELTKHASYYTIKNIGSGESSSLSVGKSVSRDYPSELGQLFYWRDNYIVFKEETEKVFNRLAEIKKYQDQDKDYDTNIRDDIYYDAAFRKNQMGNFLEYVELEQNYRQSKEKVKISLDDAKETLFEQLRKVGYEPNDNLNLANENDYNTVKNALKNKKSKILNEIAPKLRSLRGNTNPVVKERLENFENVHKALEMDSQELIAIPSTSPNLNEIAEAIKTEQANLKAKQAYDKEAGDAFDKELKKISNPYCASY